MQPALEIFQAKPFLLGISWNLPTENSSCSMFFFSFVIRKNTPSFLKASWHQGTRFVKTFSLALSISHPGAAARSPLRHVAGQVLCGDERHSQAWPGEPKEEGLRI